MNTQMSALKAVGLRIREVVTAPVRWLYGVMSSLAVATMMMAPTYCKINSNIDMDNLFANMADIIIKIAFYVGALIAIGGIFSLVIAYKDDNADGQTRAVRLIVVGVVLIGFKTILQIAGII